MLSQCNGITHFAISLRENVSPQLFLRVNDIPCTLLCSSIRRRLSFSTLGGLHTNYIILRACYIKFI